MTFNELFEQFQKQYGTTHDVIFFEIVFSLSKLANNKERFIANRTSKLDFFQRKLWKLCNDYFKKEKPLAHIVGHTTFCKLRFEVDKKVLSPRDITEQMTKDFILSHKSVPSAQLIDLCCGCGCIGISIRKYLPQFIVTCIDKYYGPFFNTHMNARKHKTPITLDCVDAIEYLNKKT
ncbi:MAG: methyltransferase [Mycoplasmoidaceae bacterium]|nr:methyltransferase [Mycoplasmoidaceae bacterium]